MLNHTSHIKAGAKLSPLFSGNLAFLGLNTMSMILVNICYNILHINLLRLKIYVYHIYDNVCRDGTSSTWFPCST